MKVKGGENIGFSKNLFVLVIILSLLSITAVSAHEIEINGTVVSVDNTTQSIELSDSVLSSPENEKPEYPDLVEKEYTYVYSSTVDNFFKNGVLDKKYQGKNLIFSGDFQNMGQLEIACNNVSINGFDSNFKNTGFLLSGNQITLNNLNFNFDYPIKENNGAVIFLYGNDIILSNLNINFDVPRDLEAYAIIADGFEIEPVENLKIINSSIYFKGHNDNVKRYNCALKLNYAQDAIVENNTIVTSLPLKNIDYTVTGANLNSAYVYSVGIEGCDRLLFNNNTVIAEVNKRTADEYPTLNCIMISNSNEVTISNNSISMTDFVTYPGVENYLYGIDIHKAKDLWIVNNTVSMVTTGGKLALGTAYPIQISGPVDGVNIEYNDLYSFSNGPNIGIYSQCYFGDTYVSIKNNKINVTGLAGTHDWALVTGIESQDTFAEIFDNQIEVHSISDVGINDNLYAISYRQSINGPNTFDIENNVAITDGYYAVYILNSYYSTIANNTLISLNDNVKTGDDSYRQGARTHYNEDYYDNRVIRAEDYLPSRNTVDNGNVIEIEGSTNSNIINTNSISGRNQQSNVVSNPLIPGFKDLSGISQENNNNVNGYIDDGSIQATIEDFDSNQNYDNQNSNDGVYIENGGNLDETDVYGNNLKIVSNSSSTASVGVSNTPINGAQSSSSVGQSKSVSKKAYEIEEMMKDDKYVPSIFIVIFVMLLLIIGYKRKNEDIN